MKILAVNINPRPGWTKDNTIIHFPIGLCSVLTQVKGRGYTFDVHDMNMDPQPFDVIANKFDKGGYDILALGGMVHTFWQIYPIIEEVKNNCPQAIVVVGGHVTAMGEDNLLKWSKADYAIKGPAEVTFPDLLDAIEEGREPLDINGVSYRKGDEIKNTPRRTPSKSGNVIGAVDWDIFDVEKYIQSSQNLESHHLGMEKEKIRSFPIVTTRGCPYKCTFCSNDASMRKLNPYRRNSAQDTADLVEMLHNKYNINHFKFQDELSFLRPLEVEELAKAIGKKKLPVTYEAICRVGLFHKENLDLLKYLKNIGFQRFYYSLESGSPKILKLMKKQILLDEFYEQKEVMDAAGISSRTNIIVGYPTENEDDLKQSFDACYNANILPSVCYLLPIPGSEMYDYALKQGYIVDEKKYIMSIGEQQYLKINMSDMSDEFLESVTLYHLKRIRDKLDLDIADDRLICSVKVRSDGELRGCDIQ